MEVRKVFGARNVGDALTKTSRQQLRTSRRWGSGYEKDVQCRVLPSHDRCQDFFFSGAWTDRLWEAYSLRRSDMTELFLRNLEWRLPVSLCDDPEVLVEL